MGGFSWAFMANGLLAFVFLQQPRTGLAEERVNKNLPQFPSTYTVDGVLRIPYAEIEEPFTAYYDLTFKRSRIDFYGGMDKQFRIGDDGEFGAHVNLSPVTTEKVTNEMNCFKISGSAANPVLPSSILPDLTGYEFKGKGRVEGRANVEKWQKEERIDHKTNKYTMWLYTVTSPYDPSLKTAVPIKFQMKGYNVLLGSHYDHYYVTYLNFSGEEPDASVFGIYKSLDCHGFPGPGSDSDDIYVHNPMREFIEGHTHHVDTSFDDFMRRHDRTYADERDFEARKDIFRQNMRFIHSHNRKHLSYTLASNHLADLTEDEMLGRKGRLRSSGYNGGHPFSYTQSELNSAPVSLDWRLYGAVTPVKDQASCGSCWSFGSVGTLEGTNFLATGQMVPYSEQALVDCSWGYGNNGCDGGEDYRAYEWILRHGGIPTSDSYGSYLGADGFCHLDDPAVVKGMAIEKWVNVTSGDRDALKVALAKHGPISVGIDAAHKSLSFYSNGVYYEPKCGNTTDALDHAVLAVGYGELNGEGYWLIKNSWSTYWGNDGYVLVAQRDNNCGIAMAPTFVVPKQTD